MSFDPTHIGEYARRGDNRLPRHYPAPKIETRPGSWRFEGVDHPQARLLFGDATGAPAPSGISCKQLVDEILRVSRPANG